MIEYETLAALVVLTGALLAVTCLLVRRPARRWWAAVGCTLVVLVLLTAVFDSLMISADLFRYSDRVLAGPRIGLAPIGDFAWPVAVSLGLPSLWCLLGGPEVQR